MNQLPPGWTTFTLRDIGGTVGGKTPSKSESAFWSARDLHWTSPKDMKSFRLKSSEDMISNAALSGAGMRILPKGSVLVVTRSGILAHTLPVSIADIETAINQDIKAVLPTERVEPRYLAYLLRSKQNEILEACSKEGTTVASVQTELLEQFPLPLAPIAEQTRIADKLDQLFASVGTVKGRLDAIPAILKRLRQSVLAAGTNGKLTEQWREETLCTHAGTYLCCAIALPNAYKRLRKKASLGASPIPVDELPALPATWCYASVNELYASNVILDYADGNHGSLYPRKEEFGDQGVLFVTAAQIQEDGSIDKGSAPRLNARKARQLVKGWAKDGDVLLTHNATVGRVAIAREINEDFLLGTSVTFYRTNSAYLDPVYLYLYFRCEAWQRQLRTVMEQTTRDQVSIQKQALFLVALPPIEEQREIARRLNTLIPASDEIERTVRTGSARAEALTRSLLAKAFSGELTSHGANNRTEKLRDSSSEDC